MPHPSKPTENLFEPTHGGKVLAMAPGLANKLQIMKYRVAAYDTQTKAMGFVESSRSQDFQHISGKENFHQDIAGIAKPM